MESSTHFFGNGSELSKGKKILTLSIEGSVGQGGKNNPVDVAVIQKMLKIFFTQRVKTKGRSTSVVSPPINDHPFHFC
jgi:hypothetical protein